MHKRIPRTFWRFLLSYLSLLLLLVVVLFIANGVVMRINQDNSVKTALSDLQNVAKEFDLRMEQMQAIVDMLAFDEDIIYRDLQDDPVAAIVMVRKLKNYARSTLYLHDLIVYMDGVKTMYGASSTYSVDSYAQRILRYENWPPSAFAEDISNLGGLLIRPMENAVTISGIRHELMTFIYKLNSNVSAGYGSVLFQVKRDEMDSVMGKAISSGDGNVLILNDAGALHYSLHPFSSEELPVLREALSGVVAEARSMVERYNGQRHIITAIPSTLSSLCFVSIIPEAAAMAQAASVSRLLNFVLIVVMVLGTAFILLFMRVNYLPIKRLGEAVCARGETPLAKQSEAEVACYMIQDLQTERETLQLRMRSTTTEMKDTLLTALLYGSLSIVQYNSLTEAYGCQIISDHFRVVVLRAVGAPREMGVALFPELGATLEMLLPACEVRYVQPSADRLIALIASDTEMEQEIIDQLATLLLSCDVLKGTRLVAAMGCCYTSWLRIHDSYLECERLLEEQDPKHGEVLCAKQQTIYYPAYEINSLLKAMGQGDKAEFLLIANTICSMVKRRLSLTTARMVGYDALRMMLAGPPEKLQGCMALQNELREQMVTIMSSKDIVEISDIFIGCCVKISELLEDVPAKPGREERMIEQVIGYIQAHCCEQSFSIQMVADAFSIRQNNLSQQFKRVTGQSPLQYVNHLRVERGKALLAKTDSPLRTIAGEVGFINESTFIRKFKAEVGMTPGEYRRNLHGG